MPWHLTDLTLKQLYCKNQTFLSTENDHLVDYAREMTPKKSGKSSKIVWAFAPLVFKLDIITDISKLYSSIPESVTWTFFEVGMWLSVWWLNGHMRKNLTNMMTPSVLAGKEEDEEVPLTSFKVQVIEKARILNFFLQSSWSVKTKCWSAVETFWFD